MVRAIACRTRSVLATSFSVALELVTPTRLPAIVRASKGPSCRCAAFIVVRLVHVSVGVGRDFARIRLCVRILVSVVRRVALAGGLGSVTPVSVSRLRILVVSVRGSDVQSGDDIG
ncbi:hypothetical protein PR002_g14830 [Phytophthora rubi]|uniref:Uncharacterized protein n=1 Tax=Phytophthora rubi TaxID=129364 RepID=A0A6A3L8G3_9STRA|nr:hypothetical protein PR002_g14830 [Phytophthora rubi]